MRDVIDQEQERERDDGGWITTDHLVAILIDKVEVLTWFIRRAHFQDKPDYPTPIERPGVKSADTAPTWSDEKIAAMVPGMASIMSR